MNTLFVALMIFCGLSAFVFVHSYFWIIEILRKEKLIKKDEFFMGSPQTRFLKWKGSRDKPEYRFARRVLIVLIINIIGSLLLLIVLFVISLISNLNTGS